MTLAPEYIGLIFVGTALSLMVMVATIVNCCDRRYNSEDFTSSSSRFLKLNRVEEGTAGENTSLVITITHPMAPVVP